MLSMFNGTVTNATAKIFIDNCPQLEILNLGYCSKISDELLLHIVAQKRNIITIELQSCLNVTDEGLIPFVQNNKGLTKISVPGTDISSDALQAVAANCKDLTQLNVQGTQKGISAKFQQNFITYR